MNDATLGKYQRDTKKQYILDWASEYTSGFGMGLYCDLNCAQWLETNFYPTIKFNMTDVVVLTLSGLFWFWIYVMIGWE